MCDSFLWNMPNIQISCCKRNLFKSYLILPWPWLVKWSKTTYFSAKVFCACSLAAKRLAIMTANAQIHPITLWQPVSKATTQTVAAVGSLCNFQSCVTLRTKSWLCEHQHFLQSVYSLRGHINCPVDDVGGLQPVRGCRDTISFSINSISQKMFNLS